MVVILSVLKFLLLFVALLFLLFVLLLLFFLLYPVSYSFQGDKERRRKIRMPLFTFAFRECIFLSLIRIGRYAIAERFSSLRCGKEGRNERDSGGH